MIVVADTTPLNYLVLIEEAHLLPRLFGDVLIPPAVFEELRNPEVETQRVKPQTSLFSSLSRPRSRSISKVCVSRPRVA